MLAGYARVSTLDQNPGLQLDALSAAGCERIFEDRASGTRSDRPRLAEALDWLRKGRPVPMLFSVVDDGSGAVWQEYRCVYGEDVESGLRFLFNAMAPDIDTTRALLIEIDAPGSMKTDKEMWSLISRNPLPNNSNAE